MKIIIMAGTLLLACCLAAAAQTKGAPGQAPSPNNDYPHATIEGCLRQVSEGNFVIVQTSGKSYQLSGDTSKLAGMIGTEIRVFGFLMAGDVSLPGAMASRTDSDSGEQISVSEASKIAETCYIDSRS